MTTTDHDTWHVPEGFNRTPRAWHRVGDARHDVPCFSAHDDYVDNYRRIARDHLDRAAPGVANPWIGDELWTELEDSTASLVRKHAPIRGSGVDGRVRILDAGVGLGRLLGRFPEMDRWGIDISTDYLHAAHKVGVRVACARLEDAPFREATFDLVVATDVLEHVLDLTGATRRLVAVLRPGGLLITRTPYREDLTPYLATDYPYEFAHVRTFDEASLRLHFERVLGLEFAEFLPVAHFLQNASRLAARFFSSNDPARQAVIEVARTGKSRATGLIGAVAMAQETFGALMRNIQENEPDVYERLKPHLVLPIEINAVWRKP